MKRPPRPHLPDTSRREARLHRIERLTELPLLVLAFAMIPLLIGPLLWSLTAVRKVNRFQARLTRVTAAAPP